MAMGPVNKPAPLNVGITNVGRWRKSDDVHLPAGSRAAPVFLPQAAELDTILRRETLDERLAGDVVPDEIAPDLLNPAVLTRTRQSLQRRLEAAATDAPERTRNTIATGAALLAVEVALDEEIQAALAALLKG